MADNVELNAGSGGATLATDDISTIHYQIVKLAHGALDAATVVSTSSGMPVQQQGNWDINDISAGTQTNDIKVTLDSEAVAISGTVTVDNGGTFAVQVDAALPAGNNNIGNVDIASSVALDVSAAVVSVDDNAGSLTVDNSDLTTIAGAVSGSEMQVDVVAALPAGSNAIGKLAANDGVDIGDVDVTSISAGSNKIGDVGISTRTSGGGSIFYDNDLDETAVAVKAGAGQIYAIHAFNTTDAPLFLQIFNVAQGSVTVGTTTPDMQYVIPGNADSDGAGFVLEVPMGIAFDTAITVACSTDNEGNTAPGANACVIDIIYA